MEEHMDNQQNINVGNIHAGLKGLYKVQVIDSKTKEIVSDYGWKPNLILNNGMDAIASVYTANLNAVGICGTGSRPNNITSSTSMITQSGANIYLVDTSGLTDFTSSYSTYAATLQTGDVIIDSDNSQSTVISVSGSGVNAVVDTNYTYVSGKTFTIWKTSQPGLEKEIHRSSTYLVGSSSAVGWNCGTVTNGNVMVHRRTYDFSAETAQKVYTEVGVSWTGTANSGVFSRILLPSPVAVSNSFQLRLIHSLQVTWEPAGERYKTAYIDGWGTVWLSESIQQFYATAVGTTGGTQNFACLEPAAFGAYNGTYAGIAACSDATVLAAFGSVNSFTATSTQAGMAQLKAYVAGSHEYFKHYTFSLNDSNGVGQFRGIGLGMVNSADSQFVSNGYSSFRVRFDKAQTKLNTQLFNVVFRWTWGRSFVA
jgi:hypothetical protein